MGEFKDASLWMRLAFLMVALGLLLDLHGLSSGVPDTYGDVRGCMIIGFLCLLVAFVLALCLIFLDELKGNKPALICLIVFALVAGLAIIIGVAMWGGNTRYYKYIATYPAMLLCMAGLLTILGGIFAILEIAGVKG